MSCSWRGRAHGSEWGRRRAQHIWEQVGGGKGGGGAWRAHRALRAEDLARVHPRHVALPHRQHGLALAEGARAAAKVRVLILVEHCAHAARRDDETRVDEAVQQLRRRLDRFLRGRVRASVRVRVRVRVRVAGAGAHAGVAGACGCRDTCAAARAACGRRGLTCCSSEKPAVAGLSTSRMVSSANS